MISAEKCDARLTRFAALLGCILLVGAVRVVAESPLPQAPLQTAETGRASERITLTAGRSTVLLTDFDVVRIAVTNPEVADAIVVGPRELLVDGKLSGTVSLIIWGATQRVQYDVAVEPPVTTLQQLLQQLFPGENIQVSAIDEAVVLSGNVSSNDVMLRAGEIAQSSSPDLRVINMLQLPGGMQSQQVMLQVRFAEVNRRALSEFGISFFTGPTGAGDYIARESTQQFPSIQYEDLERTEVDGAIALSGSFTFGDLLNLFIFNTKHNVGALINNTAIRSPSNGSAGIGFAVPVDIVNHIVPQLIAHGATIYPTLGIFPFYDDRVRRSQGGVMVARVEKGGGAEAAGLRGLHEDEDGRTAGFGSG